MFICCDKTFVTTEMILVAAPANGNKDTRSLSRTSVVYRVLYFHRGPLARIVLHQSTEGQASYNLNFTTAYSSLCYHFPSVCARENLNFIGSELTLTGA